jgi:hypothetical protein
MIDKLCNAAGCSSLSKSTVIRIVNLCITQKRKRRRDKSTRNFIISVVIWKDKSFPDETPSPISSPA